MGLAGPSRRRPTDYVEWAGRTCAAAVPSAFGGGRSKFCAGALSGDACSVEVVIISSVDIFIFLEYHYCFFGSNRVAGLAHDSYSTESRKLTEDGISR